MFSRVTLTRLTLTRLTLSRTPLPPVGLTLSRLTLTRNPLPPVESSRFFSSLLVVLLRRSGVPPLAYSSLYLLGGTPHSTDYLGQTTSSKKSGVPGFFSFQASNVFPKTFRPGEGPNRHLSFFCFVSCFCPRLCSSASALLLLLLCLCLCLLLLLVLPLPLLLLLSLHLLLLPLLLLRTVSVVPQGKTTTHSFRL